MALHLNYVTVEEVDHVARIGAQGEQGQDPDSLIALTGVTWREIYEAVLNTALKAGWRPPE